jgi:hypothetical protein
MAAQSHVKSVVAIKRHRTTEWSRLRRRFVHVRSRRLLTPGGLSSYFGEVSHSIQTGSVIGRTLFHTGGRCRGGWQCHISGSPGTMPRKDSRREDSRREEAVSLGISRHLRTPASIISLIWPPAFPRAGLKRWPVLGKAPARRAWRRGISSTAMSGLSTTIRVETNQ